MGGGPARPRRAHLRGPPGPERHLPAHLPAGGGAEGPREREGPAGGERHRHARHGDPPRRGEPQPPDPHGRGGGGGRRDGDPQPGPPASVPGRGRPGDRRGNPPALPVPRPAPPPDAPDLRDAPPARVRDAPVPRRSGLPRGRDPDPHQVDARGGARLPRALPRAPGRVLRAPAVPAAVQAAPDGRGVRAVLPDRALLPRRGPARRPPARVHADRHRDVVHRAGRHLRARRTADRPPRRGRGTADPGPVPAPDLGRGDGPLRHRQAGPPVRTADRRARAGRWREAPSRRSPRRSARAGAVRGLVVPGWRLLQPEAARRARRRRQGGGGAGPHLDPARRRRVFSPRRSRRSGRRRRHPCSPPRARGRATCS